MLKDAPAKHDDDAKEVKHKAKKARLSSTHGNWQLYSASA